MKHEFIYTLELENGRYYVGKSSRPVDRVNFHFENRSTPFLKMYKPVKLVECFKSTSAFDEDNTVKKYMNRFGIDKVRGGSYTNRNFSLSQTECLVRELDSSRNACFKCGKQGHFSKECKQKNRCFRCGRTSHYADSCFAKTNVFGHLI